MKFPKIFLAIDNCFASKRWTEPEEWISVIRDLGIRYVEASADNECDPLYTTPEYLAGWIAEIVDSCEKYGVKVCNIYSGHGTYATLGLGHTNENIRDHILNNWLKKMVDISSSLHAGLGFYCHAFNHQTLQDKNRYIEAYTDLINRLGIIAKYAAQANLKTIGVEQMYTPHQIPWTVHGAKQMLKDIYAQAEQPFYITIDVGHQSGQRKFLKPDMDTLRSLSDQTIEEPSPWLGLDRTCRLFNEARTLSNERKEEILVEIMNEMDDNPHMFASFEDGDPYYWLENMGKYSPIIHLQQTDGKHSSHWPFTKEYNENGIISGEKVLEKLYTAYLQKDDKGMPPKCRKIYLTIEVFSSTADIPIELLKNLEKTVEYWRKFVPEDGCRLNKLLKK